MFSSFLRECRTPSSAAAKMWVQLLLLSLRLSPIEVGKRNSFASWRRLECVPGWFGGESKLVFYQRGHCMVLMLAFSSHSFLGRK